MILLQSAFAAILLVFLLVSFNYLYRDVIETLLQGIQESIASGGRVGAGEIFESIQAARKEHFNAIIFITIFITIVAGYFIGYVTLTPSRNALASQRRFMGDVAHEIRTPLSIIKTNCEVALLGRDMDGETREAFRSNIEELDRISEIINNVLSFSYWMRSERMAFDCVDMSSAVRNAASSFETLVKTKGQNLLMKADEESVFVMGNAAALEQIAANVIKNAINYTPAAGRIIVSASKDRMGNALFIVEDSGIGISRADLPHIFNPFFRSEKSRSRRNGSSGLGLAIVSELVKIHQGKIVVQSKPGRGTKITVLFPLCAPSKLRT